MRRDTEIQHLGEDRESYEGAASPPVYRTSLFTFPDTATLTAWFRGDRERHLYSRDSNPTVRILERKVAALERTEDAIAFASGMGAISAVLLAHLRSGDHLVLFARSYGPTLIFARDVLSTIGVDVTWLGPDDVGRLAAEIRPETRLVYVESPASLTMDVLDLEAIAATSRARGVPTATDNSWATPILQRPVELGIDLVVHSGTKYLAGHSDILLGLLAGRAEALNRMRPLASLLGAALSPADAALAIRGLRTLPIRMERHGASALEIARRLESHPRVVRVLHPGLPSFPGHELWERQFDGASGLFSFVVRGDAASVCDRLTYFGLGVSWGGFESLAFPAVASMGPDPTKGVRPDIDPGLIRLSVGLEDVEDLWSDLEAALG